MDEKYKFWQYLIPYAASKYGMGAARLVASDAPITLENIKKSVQTGSEPQSGFLLDRGRQKRYMLNNGYTIDNTGNYGLVKKAVGNRNLPIYQTPGLSVDNDGHMTVIGNTYSNDDKTWLGTNGAIAHGGHYPTALYYNDKDNNFYQRGWDLNDYGKSENEEGKSHYSIKYSKDKQHLANALDYAGNPMVISTGYRKTPFNINNITLDPSYILDTYLHNDDNKTPDDKWNYLSKFKTLQRSFDKYLRERKNSMIYYPYTDVDDLAKYYEYELDANGYPAYDAKGRAKVDYSKPKKEIHDGIIVNTTTVPEVVAKRKHKSLGGIY